MYKESFRSFRIIKALGKRKPGVFRYCEALPNGSLEIQVLFLVQMLLCPGISSSITSASTCMEGLMLLPSLQTHLLSIKVLHTAQKRHFHYEREEMEIFAII